MNRDAFRDEDAARTDRPSHMRVFIAAGLMGMCLLGVLGGMLHVLPA